MAPVFVLCLFVVVLVLNSHDLHNAILSQWLLCRIYENAKQDEFYFLKSSDFARGVIIEEQMAGVSVTNTAQQPVIQQEQ